MLALEGPLTQSMPSLASGALAQQFLRSFSTRPLPDTGDWAVERLESLDSTHRITFSRAYSHGESLTAGDLGIEIVPASDVEAPPTWSLQPTR